VLASVHEHTEFVVDSLGVSLTLGYHTEHPCYRLRCGSSVPNVYPRLNPKVIETWKFWLTARQ